MRLAEFIYTVILRPRPLRIAANALLRAMLPSTRRVNGAIVHLNPDDPVVSGALTLGVYEKDEIAFFERVIEPEMIFVDVGANVGLYTALGLRRMRYPGKIICVEPDPASASFLKQTIRSNQVGGQSPKVSLYQLALSDTQGELILHKNPENKGDNRIYADSLCTEAIRVRTDTLDSLMESEAIEEINLIKIDVQGAEAKVLAGARRVLQKSTDCVMVTEFWPYGLASSGSSPSAYLSALEDLGLNLYSLDGTTLRAVLDHQALIASCPGRAYRNLVGVKGRFKNKVCSPTPMRPRRVKG
jgi:FkbM family methyltransferase